MQTIFEDFETEMNLIVLGFLIQFHCATNRCQYNTMLAESTYSCFIYSNLLVVMVAVYMICNVKKYCWFNLKNELTLLP